MHYKAQLFFLMSCPVKPFFSSPPMISVKCIRKFIQGTYFDFIMRGFNNFCRAHNFVCLWEKPKLFWVKPNLMETRAKIIVWCPK